MRVRKEVKRESERSERYIAHEHKEDKGGKDERTQRPYVWRAGSRVMLLRPRSINIDQNSVAGCLCPPVPEV